MACTTEQFNGVEMCPKSAYRGIVRCQSNLWVQELTKNHLLEGGMRCHPCSSTALKENRIWTLKSSSLSNRSEVFPIEEYCWLCFLCVWTSSDNMYCKAFLFRSGLSNTVRMNGNLSQVFVRSRIESSVNKVGLFSTICLVWLCWVLHHSFSY